MSDQHSFSRKRHERSGPLVRETGEAPRDRLPAASILRPEADGHGQPAGSKT